MERQKWTARLAGAVARGAGMAAMIDAPPPSRSQMVETVETQKAEKGRKAERQKGSP